MHNVSVYGVYRCTGAYACMGIYGYACIYVCMRRVSVCFVYVLCAYIIYIYIYARRYVYDLICMYMSARRYVLMCIHKFPGAGITIGIGGITSAINAPLIFTVKFPLPWMGRSAVFIPIPESYISG